MFRPFSHKLLLHQLRYLYFFLPTVLYFILLIFYPSLQSLIFSRTDLHCYTKNNILVLDEYIFSWFYTAIDYSFNLALLTVFAIPYLIHFINPILYIAYLVYKRPGYACFWKFVLAFGLTNAFSILIQSSYPTGPPWYYLGFPNEAKFYLVDNLFHFKVFHTLYGLNKLICGAFPSLHVGWPTVIAMNGVVNIYFGIGYVVLIGSAAIYSRHHWIIDIVCGVCIAIGMSLAAGKVVDWVGVKEDVGVKEETLVEEKGREIEMGDRGQKEMVEKQEIQLFGEGGV